ncbi:OsmC family protein [Prauserella muralis]|uniref:Uncharacterized protein n=1 Tax=Prauserella muralis TaxID=588067 RepID=A0A2V4APW8_9PSEU|nr:OsmC family protein [Prauserella muralis]PXY22627.1 hypothetical protein BAY60_22660 [Prauserella muralis]TWE28334.1 putative OsmC-like protein [Prauserella muralis]
MVALPGGRSPLLLEEKLAKLAADPASAHTELAVVGTVDGDRVRLAGAPFAWYADLPRAVGGGNCAPSPVLYLLGALAGCAVSLIRDVLAPQLGIALTDVTAVARCGQDLAGLAGLDGGDPGLNGISIEIGVASPAPPERVAELRLAWQERSPVYLALAAAVPVSVTWSSGPASSVAVPPLAGSVP